jgi:hypothetical protein
VNAATALDTGECRSIPSGALAPTKFRHNDFPSGIAPQKRNGAMQKQVYTETRSAVGALYTNYNPCNSTLLNFHPETLEIGPQQPHRAFGCTCSQVRKTDAIRSLPRLERVLAKLRWGSKTKRQKGQIAAPVLLTPRRDRSSKRREKIVHHYSES